MMPASGEEHSPEPQHSTKTPQSAEPQRNNALHDAHHGFWLHAQALCEILTILLFCITFLAQPFRIPSASMTPALRVGDMLLGNKQAYSPHGPLDFLLAPTTVHRGDIIIFLFPPNPQIDVVKRVIAIPGDHIRLHNGAVILNGTQLTEPYARYIPSAPNDFRDNFPSMRYADPGTDPAWWATLRRTVVNHEITVPPGQYFVLGDNRNDSEDSRYWGFVPRSMILARPTFVYLSFAPPASTSGTFTHRIWSNLHHELSAIRIVR